MASQAQAQPMADRPDHIPESLVYAFDMFNDPEYLAVVYFERNAVHGRDGTVGLAQLLDSDDCV